MVVSLGMLNVVWLRLPSGTIPQVRGLLSTAQVPLAATRLHGIFLSTDN
jgi:hypothetical protein